MPVSSSTSRTAAAVACSPRSTLPLGKDQSSYFGRWTSSTVPPGPRTTAPADTTSRSRPDGMMLSVASQGDEQETRLAQPWSRRLTVVAGALLALVLLAVVAVLGVRWWQDRQRSDLEQALAYAP